MQVNEQQHGRHAISTPDALLWWMATAEPGLIKDFEVDRNRYRITGLIVLCTAIFASLAWTYFFSTIVSSTFIYVPMGLFMGFVVLSIDRALIKGISKTNKNKLGPLFLRGLLAITIGLFMAQPAVLYLFDKEVKMQASLDNEGRKQTKRRQLDSLYAGQKSELLAEKTRLQNNIQLKYDEMLAAQQVYLAETDGTGGSGKVGISTIALAKKQAYEKLFIFHTQTKLLEQPKIDTLESKLAKMETAIKQQEEVFATLLNNGFLTRIEAMQHLVKGNQAVAFRYYLIVAILMLIELMPVIIKTMMPSGPYELQVETTDRLNKESVIHHANVQRALEIAIEEKTIANNAKTVDYMHDQLIESQRKEIDGLISTWETTPDQSISSWWLAIRRRLFG